MNADYFDHMPQKFYLLSVKNRRLFSYESVDRKLEVAIEEAFNKLPRLEGGNVYAEFKYQPLMLKVMTELSESLKGQYPEVQQLPAYMRQLEEGDIFFRQQVWAPMPDLKRTLAKLRALKAGREPRRDDDAFVLSWCRLYLVFETYSFGFLTEKVFVGEADPTKRVCRFCRKRGADRFAQKSHAIMDGLGNKLLFCNEECDVCNQEFEADVERQLYKFMEIPRTLACVKGKKSHNHHLEGANFHIHSNHHTSKPVVYVKNDGIINDMYKGKATGKILLFNSGEISFWGIYKSLVKIALDLIPEDKIPYFEETRKWVHGDIDGGEMPGFLYGEHNEFFEQPELDIFFRKECSLQSSPYSTVVLYMFSSVFVYTIPLCEKDGARFTRTDALREHYELFKKYQYLQVADWELFDANDRTPKSPIYKLHIFPQNDEYEVRFRPSNNEVFEIKR